MENMEIVHREPNLCNFLPQSRELKQLNQITCSIWSQSASGVERQASKSCGYVDAGLKWLSVDVPGCSCAVFLGVLCLKESVTDSGDGAGRGVRFNTPMIASCILALATQLSALLWKQRGRQKDRPL